VVRKTTLNQQGVLNVRTSLRFATIVAGILSISLTAAGARAQTRGSVQHPRPSSQGGAVVVIDIGYIFKNHTRFKGKIADMRKDVTESEQLFRSQRKQIADMAEGLKELNPGTPEYSRREEKITRAEVKLQADMALKRKEFMLREARIYYDIYTEIVKEVEYYSRQHGIGMVLRYNSEPIDPQKGNSVMKGVNRNVVYQRNRNITTDILNRLIPPRTVNPKPSDVGPRRYR